MRHSCRTIPARSRKPPSCEIDAGALGGGRIEAPPVGSVGARSPDESCGRKHRMRPETRRRRWAARHPSCARTNGCGLRDAGHGLSQRRARHRPRKHASRRDVRCDPHASPLRRWSRLAAPTGQRGSLGADEVRGAFEAGSTGRHGARRMPPVVDAAGEPLHRARIARRRTAPPGDDDHRDGLCAVHPDVRAVCRARNADARLCVCWHVRCSTSRRRGRCTVALGLVAASRVL